VTLQNTPLKRQELMKWLDQGYGKLNIGGGPKNLQGFINIDFVNYPNVQRQLVANIQDLAFIPDGCISQVHSNHVIEHLSNIDLKNQIREWDRILKKEGLLTIRCPNALGAAYGFWFEPIIETQKAEFIRLGFPADEDFGNLADRWIHKDLFGLVHWFYGDAGNIGNQHLSRLTPSIMLELLFAQGFSVLKMTEPEAINIVVVARKGTPGS
jgi:SAM-dependent methyltransferase